MRAPETGLGLPGTRERNNRIKHHALRATLAWGSETRGYGPIYSITEVFLHENIHGDHISARDHVGKGVIIVGQSNSFFGVVFGKNFYCGQFRIDKHRNSIGKNVSSIDKYF